MSGKRQGFTDKLLKINNLSGRRRVSTDESHCRDNKNQEKLFVALFRIHQRIMGKQRRNTESTKRLEAQRIAEGCRECQVTKRRREHKRRGRDRDGEMRLRR